MRATTPTAISAADRIIELDVWRGFALLGVCIVNFVNLNLLLLSDDRADTLLTAGLDWRMEFLVGVFLGNKAHTIFTFLFGVGIAIMMSRLQSVQASANKILAKRFLILLVFGWAHCMFLYFGDVLHIYAVLGLLMILLSRLGDRTLLLVGLILALGSRLVYAEAEFFGFDRMAATSTFTSDAEIGVDASYAIGNFWSISEFLQFNMTRCMEKADVIARQIFVGAYYLGRVMIGFALWRSGCVSRLLETRDKNVWSIAGVLIAISVALTVTIAMTEPGEHGTLQHFVFNGTRHVSFLVLAAAYLVTLLGLAKGGALKGVLSGFASVGRMSLTNYVAQSLGMMLLLLGPGLHLGGHIGTLAAASLAAAFFLAQIAFSRRWLRSFAQGPLEYAWRKAVYAR